jgi:DNA-binding response OmpR family regulator
MRVLVVEDETQLADTIARGLRRRGMSVDVTYDGETGLEAAQVNRYDVVVLDRDLPRLHGDDLCRSLAVQRIGPRILMLTAAGQLEDRVAGLEMGADDYLPKPFAFTELVARLGALARRAELSLPTLLSARGIELDPARHVVRRDGRPLSLANKEFGVLQVLLAAGGAVVSAEELLERVWDENADPFTNTVRVTVMKLRKKLGEPPVIETVASAGYRI